MKVYIDTGIFLNYLSKQALGGASLRSTQRRGRSPQKLFEGAASVLKKLADSHEGATSCFTYYEVEEARLRQWEAVAKEVANANKLRVLAARSIMPQTALAVQFFQIKELELTAAIVSEQLNHHMLHIAGVRAADALHVATAILFGADLIVSSDDDVLQLDNQVTNNAGTTIRCLDSDAALSIL